ncbi:AP-1 complex-associated regulatory protein-like isoform X1 [Ylistrum balloti]|uniref:AP-1 complex-associated regulatory protein-like isoform X1 n=1 Tax=Ylistrum balloti TaxID=509963 RepID=UPI002905E04D|nr:AP-1 complex-associated regulatory protein-like isoform X1 [Ylistrum balloti]
MGNCIGRCFGISRKKRKYLKTRYSVERDISVEFENLMDDDSHADEMSRLVTEREKQLVASKQYTALLHEQKERDRKIDKQLAQREEELRLEEEKFYEAKREAARTAKLQRAKEAAARDKNANRKSKSWVGDDEGEWEIAGGEDDFEMFLASVKARSYKATAHLRQGSGDGQSSNSSGTTQTRDRSHTEGSSLDLEWEHEEGVVPQKKTRSSTEENLVTAFVHKSRDSPVNSTDLEWDNDFVTAETTDDTEHLLAAEMKIQEFSSR